MATAKGTLTATEADSHATVGAKSSVAKSFGSLSINAGGAWSYTLDDSNG